MKRLSYWGIKKKEASNEIVVMHPPAGGTSMFEATSKCVLGYFWTLVSCNARAIHSHRYRLEQLKKKVDVIVLSHSY